MKKVIGFILGLFLITNFIIEVEAAELDEKLIQLDVETPKAITITPKQKTTTQQITTNLPMNIGDDQKVLIAGFPEESLANYIATQYYRRADRDMLLTMLGENGGFDIYSKSPTNDHGLCQWHYDSSTKTFIDSPDFYNVEVQMNECIRLWNQTKVTGRNKTKRSAYKIRMRFVNRITLVSI